MEELSKMAESALLVRSSGLIRTEQLRQAPVVQEVPRRRRHHDT